MRWAALNRSQLQFYYFLAIFALFTWMFTAPTNAQSEAFSVQTVKDDSISVNIFLLEDCVICAQMMEELNSLYEHHQDQFAFTGFFPNLWSKPASIEAFGKKYKVKFPLKTDHFQTRMQAYGIRVTPEVVVFNHTTATVLYKGRIDNSYVRVGRKRRVVNQRDLREVLKALSDGTFTTPYRTEAVGCIINAKK